MLMGLFLKGRLRHDLSERERRALEGTIARTVKLAPRSTLVTRGDRLENSYYLIDGVMLRHLDDKRGDRQLVEVNIAGDFVDLHGYAMKRLDHNVQSLTNVTLAEVPHTALSQVVEEFPHLGRALWFSTLLDAAIHRQWILKMEELPAPRRVAHIFAELWHRLDLVGLGRRDGLRTPLIQADLADMCGTTAIHMNRALGVMRKEGIAEFRRGSLYVPNRAKLEAFAGFNPDYLYGEGGLRVGGELTAPTRSR